MTTPTTQQSLIRAMYVTMRSRRDQYKSTFMVLPYDSPKKDVFKQLAREMEDWVEMFEKAFPDETKD